MSPMRLYTVQKTEKEADQCERRKVIKDFCFPDKLKCKAVVSIDELRSDINSQVKYFAFTLNSNEELSRDGA